MIVYRRSNIAPMRKHEYYFLFFTTPAARAFLQAPLTGYKLPVTY